MTVRRNISGLVLLSLSILLLALTPGSAQAAVTCEASMTDLNFGAVDPLSGDTAATATLNWSCTNDSPVFGANIRICFSIGAGSNGSGQTRPRQISGSNSPLQFQLYKDASGSQAWGSVHASATTQPLEEAFSLPVAWFWNPRPKSGSATLYGKIPGNQPGVAAGNYHSLFSGAEAMISFNYTETIFGTGFPSSS